MTNPSSVSEELVEIANECFEEGAVLRDHVRNALNAIAPRLKAEGLREARECQPSTAEDPNESSYQRGRFDGIMEYACAINACLARLDPPPQKE